MNGPLPPVKTYDIANILPINSLHGAVFLPLQTWHRLKSSLDQLSKSLSTLGLLNNPFVCHTIPSLRRPELVRPSPCHLVPFLLSLLLPDFITLV